MVGILAVVSGGAEPAVTDAPTEAPQNSATTGRSPAPASAHRKQRGRPNQASQPSSQTDRSLRRTPETQIPGHHRTGRPRRSARNPVSIHPDHGPAPWAPRQSRNIGALSRSGRDDEAPGILGQPPSSGTPLTSTARVTQRDIHLINRGLAALAAGAERRPPPCWVTSAPGPPQSRKSCPRPAAPSARIAALSCSRLCKGRASVLTDSVLCGLGRNWKQTTLQHPCSRIKVQNLGASLVL